MDGVRLIVDNNRDALKGMIKDATEVFDDMVTQVDKRLDQEEADDDKYVQRMPELP